MSGLWGRRLTFSAVEYRKYLVKFANHSQFIYPSTAFIGILGVNFLGKCL